MKLPALVLMCLIVRRVGRENALELARELAVRAGVSADGTLPEIVTRIEEKTNALENQES